MELCEFDDGEWKYDFVISVDIVQHMNDLN
jgi:hypothetical protein